MLGEYPATTEICLSFQFHLHLLPALSQLKTVNTFPPHGLKLNCCFQQWRHYLDFYKHGSRQKCVHWHSRQENIVRISSTSRTSGKLGEFQQKSHQMAENNI